MSLTYSALDDLTDTLMQEAPGCPRNQVTYQLSRAVREFLIRTKAWKSKISIPMESDKTVYTFDVVPDVYVDELDSSYIEGMDALGDVELIGEIEFEVSSEFADQNADSLLELTCSIVPLVLPCTIPTRLVNRYSEILTDGALAYIFGSIGKAYSNPGEAQGRKMNFKRGIRRSLHDLSSSNKGKSTSWRG